MHCVHSFGIILLLASFGAILEATDYCKLGKCGSHHIGCNNRGEFGRNCKKPTVVDLKPLIPMILEMHNKKRDEVAGGKTNLRPAVRMATMQWDDELAALAELNVKGCKVQHDHCHSTEKFKYSGQNTIGIGYKGNQSKFSDEHIVKARLEKWLSESANCTMENIRSFTHAHGVMSVGHFTIMVTDRNTHVGCGAVRDGDDGHHAFFLTCNYASINLMDEEVYKDGDEPASRCSTGTDPTYHNLCSIKEFYKLH